ncbi:9849_t:CDS:2, partial [Paraglomus occultum]
GGNPQHTLYYTPIGRQQESSIADWTAYAYDENRDNQLNSSEAVALQHQRMVNSLSPTPTSSESIRQGTPMSIVPTQRLSIQDVDMSLQTATLPQRSMPVVESMFADSNDSMDIDMDSQEFNDQVVRVTEQLNKFSKRLSAVSSQITAELSDIESMNDEDDVSDEHGFPTEIILEQSNVKGKGTIRIEDNLIEFTQENNGDADEENDEDNTSIHSDDTQMTETPVTHPTTINTTIPPSSSPHQSSSLKPPPINNNRIIMEPGQLQNLIDALTNGLNNIQFQAPAINIPPQEQNVMIYDVRFTEGITNPRKFLDELSRRFDANMVNNFARRVELLCSFVPETVAHWANTWRQAHNANGRWRLDGNIPESFYHQFVQKYMTPQLRTSLYTEYQKLELKKGQTIDKFIQGLPKSMKTIVYQQGAPDTLNAAIQRAENAQLAQSFDDGDNNKDANKNMLLIVEKLEELSKKVAENPSSNPPAVYTAGRMPVSNQGMPKRTRNNNNNFNRSYRSNNNYNNNNQFGGRNRSGNVRCYNCGKPGHIKRWCQEPTCDNCGGTRELSGNPPLLRLQGHDARRSGPLEIIAELGGVQRNVVIDTGAEINVIARDFVWQNGWKNMVKEQKNEILGISNQVIKSDGKLVLEVSIKGATVPVEFLVVPVTNIYAILGIEFVKAHDVELKFNKDESYMKWRPKKNEDLRQ